MKRLGLLSLLAVLSANAQSRAPRANSNPLLALTAAIPSGTPFPELPANLPARTAGQSSTVNGALHLTTCTEYQVTVCAASGQTLAGAGTLSVYYWSDWMSPSSTGWPRNAGLDETISVTSTSCAGAACRCQTFPTHAATGLGWIYVAPNAVTTSDSSSVRVLIEAVCAS